MESERKREKKRNRFGRRGEGERGKEKRVEVSDDDSKVMVADFSWSVPGNED